MWGGFGRPIFVWGSKMIFSDTELGKGASLPDPFQEWKWAVIGGVPFGEQFSVNHYYIENIELPFKNVQVDQIFAAGKQFSYPAFENISAFTVNFYADSEGRSLKWILHWKSLVLNPTTRLYGLPKDYLRDWTVGLMNPKGEVTVKAKLIGTWPADTNSVSLSQNNGRVVMSQNFSIDDVVWTI